MPNNLVFNTVASQLQAVVNGVDNTGATQPLLLSTNGEIQIGTVTVTAENLSIRPLSGATDSILVANTMVTVTAQNLSIRQLSGVTDSLLVANTMVTVTAENLGIRPLSGATDSVIVANTMVTVTAQNLGIRPLTGATDSVLVGNTMVTVTAQNLSIRQLSGVTDSLLVANTMVTVTAENLSIRPLSGATDSVLVANTMVTVTAQNLSIRPLSAVTDSIEIGAKLFTESNTTIDGVTDSAGIFAQQTGGNSMYSFYVYNTGTNTLTAQLQISPTDVNAYYYTDSTSVIAIPGGGKAVLVPAKFLKYTRLFYQTGGAACTFAVYYNAQV